MNINQLLAFQQVMLTGSVTGAARNLGRSQPAISALIAGLEGQLGLALFERRRGRLHPVPEAHFLAEECGDILDRLRSLRQNMRNMKTLKAGEIRMVSMPGPAVFLLPNLLADFVQNRPNVDCTLNSRSSPNVYQLVASQQYDIGLADYEAHPPSAMSQLNVEKIELDCLLAIPSSDPLAKRQTIDATDISNRPLAVLDANHETHINTARRFAEAGATMNVRFTTQYFIPLLTFVERGLAVALVDPLTARSHQLNRGDASTLAFKPLEPSVQYTMAIMRPAHRPASLLVKSFYESLMATFEDIRARFGPQASPKTTTRTMKATNDERVYRNSTTLGAKRRKHRDEKGK